MIVGLVRLVRMRWLLGAVLLTVVAARAVLSGALSRSAAWLRGVRRRWIKLGWRLGWRLAPVRSASESAWAGRVAPAPGGWGMLVRRALLVAAGSSAAVYVVWRALFTVGGANPLLGVALLVVEVGLLANAALFWWVVWGERREARFRMDPSWTVDVFITTYNEAPELVRATALGALAMEFPHTTYILDDGRREQVRELAAEIGCGYITRPDNAGAKAGSINNALGVTDGQFVAVFDADHVPQRRFLTETLGYFVDPKMAIVQAPQDYYNLSSIQHDAEEAQPRRPLEGGAALSEGHWHEQRIFFDVVMPAKNRTNSAFWCGSCAVLRREAIDSVGGMSTECVIEDMLTAQLMHAQGWKTWFLPVSLAYGLAPDDASQFQVQRVRWAQGAMQILRSGRSPLRVRGLSLAQRLSYFSSISTYFDSHLRLLLIVLPMVVLFTGAAPFETDLRSYLTFAVPPVVAGMGCAVLLHGGVRNLLRQERFTIAKMFISIQASQTLLTGSRSLGFAVTPKTGDGAGSPYLYGILGLLVLSVAAAVSGVVGLMGYGPAAGLDAWLATGNLFWILANGALLSSAVPVLRGRVLRRQMYRFPWRVAVAYRNRRTGETRVGGTLDVSWQGMGVTGEAEVGDVLELVVRPMGGEPVRLVGEVRSAVESQRRLGLSLALSERLALDQLMLAAVLDAPRGQHAGESAFWGAVERELVAG